jgi:beta-galactosidase
LTRESIDFEWNETKAGLQVTTKAAYLQQDKIVIVSTWRYLVSQDGEVAVEVDVELANGLPSLPRIGLELCLYDHGVSDHQESVNWLGRGPHENYPDRKASARIGRYQLPLKQMHTDYIFPSENGLRCDVSEAHIGELSVRGDFHFAVSEFSQDNLAQAKHTNELVKQDTIFVRIDGFHMGVGGDDSWTPSVHKEYLLSGNRYRYQVAISF